MIILHREKCWGKVIRWDIRITIVWIWKWIVLRSMVYDNDWAIIALWLIITLFRWTRTCWCSVAGCWRAREPTVGTPIIIAHPWCGWYWWCWCRLIIASFRVKFWQIIKRMTGVDIDSNLVIVFVAVLWHICRLCWSPGICGWGG